MLDSELLTKQFHGALLAFGPFPSMTCDLGLTVLYKLVPSKDAAAAAKWAVCPRLPWAPGRFRAAPGESRWSVLGPQGLRCWPSVTSKGGLDGLGFPDSKPPDHPRYGRSYTGRW